MYKTQLVRFLPRSKALQLAQFDESLGCVVSKPGPDESLYEALSWLVAEGHTVVTSYPFLLVELWFIENEEAFMHAVEHREVL